VIARRLRGILVGSITTVTDRVLRSRPLMRAPIGVYRAHLGFLFGSRLLMLEHVGRKTGAARYVVLEVIRRPGPDRYVVTSGFGERAQWFRNVMAEPQVRISSGRRTAAPAMARRMAQDEADAALSDYIAGHPGAWARLKGVLEKTLDGRVDPPGTDLPMVELSLR
jgi:deazaflavin-dependent oxidoreductase (nitroreductase family)